MRSLLHTGVIVAIVMGGLQLTAPDRGDDDRPSLLPMAADGARPIPPATHHDDVAIGETRSRRARVFADSNVRLAGGEAVPTLTIKSVIKTSDQPLEGERRTKDGNVRVVFNVKDLGGGNKIKGRTNRTDTQFEEQVGADGEIAVDVKLEPGDNTLTFWIAKDGTKLSEAAQIVVTRIAPKLTFVKVTKAGKDTGADRRAKDADVKGVFNVKDLGDGNKIKGRTNRTETHFEENVGADGEIAVDVKLEPGDNTLTFWIEKDGTRLSAEEQVVITLDTTGPILESADLIQDSVRGDYLHMRFSDDDWPDKLERTSFVIKGQNNAGLFSDPITPQGTPKPEGRFITLPMPKLYEGLYELRIYSADDAGKGIVALKDRLGNGAKPVDVLDGAEANGQRWQFSALGDRKFGEHVAFPQYSPPKQEEPPEKGFNPADFVQTRVVRLYYFRDAHRVAQIINRNVRSLNQAAVEQAERRAEKARIDADEKTDARRKAEREAVRAAEAARTAENKLFAAQQTLELMRDLDGQLKETESDLTGATTSKTKELEAKKTELERQARRLGADPADMAAKIGSLEASVKAMEGVVANLREEAIHKQESAAEAEAKEDRARESQFRQEVAAAEEDPDTYVAGDVQSVDPVTQVSISVIGEGLIQLRGPIKGINKIRTMINQMDAPLGQIKIGINTIQVNGEHGDRMERVVGRIESHIDLSRFMTNQSLLLLRRSIQEGAAGVAQQCMSESHYQVDRDRKYLYAFFGRDFIDELYEMDSEFLRSENKILSLHSMDTISLNRALFVLALAKNDVRQQILSRFMQLVSCELPQAEWDFRRSSELFPHKTHRWLPQFEKGHIEAHTLEAVCRNARQRYHFRNFRGFFETGIWQSDTINPVQREFLRLAQIFKSQMVAEVELKQRIIERALIEDPSSDEGEINTILQKVHKAALPLVQDAYSGLLDGERDLQEAMRTAILAESKVTEASLRMRDASHAIDEAIGRAATGKSIDELVEALDDNARQALLSKSEVQEALRSAISDYRALIRQLQSEDAKVFSDSATFLTIENLQEGEDILKKLDATRGIDVRAFDYLGGVWIALQGMRREAEQLSKGWNATNIRFRSFMEAISNPYLPLREVKAPYTELRIVIEDLPSSELRSSLGASVEKAYTNRFLATQAEFQIDRAEYLANRTREKLDHRKLLNFLIDEHEEKYIELVEGTLSHIATVDNYLKRLAIALEDDFKVQFYDPAFVRIRGAAREYDVTLAQVERTTVLTNNRAFAKVSPQATMEFDLPKRNIAIVEALDGAKALAEDYGALLNDPTFLAAYQMMGGGPQASTVRNMVPGLPSSTDQHEMGLVPDDKGKSDSALQGLVPDPSVYKFETGTGFEIRPVIQPDGDSVIYDFLYLYTTNVREPVDADEKHLGRIKRHFVNTQVQTSSFELREISRYQVALKASRTSRGVPLLEDIPIAGAVFRPAPSDESAIQQNIILGSTTVYPTLFDLMGLRWAPHVVDLDHLDLLDTEHVVRGRRDNIRDYVFDEASSRVDKFLHIQRTAPGQHRPDLYREQRTPSPYHPRGYTQPGVTDPTGREFERVDRRPPEMRIPPYDPHRPRPVVPERVPGVPAETVYPETPEIIQPQMPLPTGRQGEVIQPMSYGSAPSGSEQTAKPEHEPIPIAQAIRKLLGDKPRTASRSVEGRR